MRVAITGASGMVGTALSNALRVTGHDPIAISRHATPGGVHWDPAAGQIDAAALEGVDAVVNLAGENLARGRWTAARKHALWHSRIDGTLLLADALATLRQPPPCLISVSAVGYYGDRGDELLEESTHPGGDFLGRLCVAWEDAANGARAAAIRVVHPRFGVILSPRGGSLDKMVPLFKLGLGGRFGDGQQWMSWIALDDVIGAIEFCIANVDARGPINFVSPNAVRNAEFARVLATVLHRPALLPAPAFALRLAVGEMADAALLSSQHATPTALMQLGYRFRQPTLGAALQSVLGG